MTGRVIALPPTQGGPQEYVLGEGEYWTLQAATWLQTVANDASPANPAVPQVEAFDPSGKSIGVIAAPALTDPAPASPPQSRDSWVLSHATAWTPLQFVNAFEEQNPFTYDGAHGIWTANYDVHWHGFEIALVAFAHTNLANPNRLWVYLTNGLATDPVIAAVSSPLRTVGGNLGPNGWQASTFVEVDMVQAENFHAWIGTGPAPGVGPGVPVNYDLPLSGVTWLT